MLYAEPDYVVYTHTAPAPVAASDPSFKDQWALLQVVAPPAWAVTTGSSDVKVCIIDTGAEWTHPDLAGNVQPGYNAVTNTPGAVDEHGHGTHLSGTVGALGNNKVGVTGINWKSNVLPCKFMGANGAGMISDAIECVYWCRDQGAAVISISWGNFDPAQALKDAMTEVSDVLFVTSAGNAAANNDLGVNATSPGSFNLPNQVSAAATDAKDALAPYSSFGPSTVHIAAPGTEILSTLKGATYGILSGTSQAAPHVAGAAALLKAAKPDLSVADLKAALLNGVDKLSSLDGKVASGGRLNIVGALQQVVPDQVAAAVAAQQPQQISPTPTTVATVDTAAQQASSPSIVATSTAKKPTTTNKSNKPKKPSNKKKPKARRLLR